MVIWLTGCTAGLGKALLKEFCTEKNVIVGGGRRLERLAELSKVYQNAYFFELDVEHQESVEKFCEKAMNTTGAPDILINNAAMINAREKLWNISTEDFDQLTNINLNGVARMIRSTVPEMIKRGSGIIVNLSSGWGRSTSPGVAPYCASKWAIEGLTQAMAQELPSGIAAVALNPGVIHTEMLEIAFGDDAKDCPPPDEWAKVAAPYIIGLSEKDNGASLTVPF